MGWNRCHRRHKFRKDLQLIKAIEISRAALAVSSQLEPSGYILIFVLEIIWAVLLNDIFVK